jgi:hypothetical protein
MLGQPEVSTGVSYQHFCGLKKTSISLSQDALPMTTLTTPKDLLAAVQELRKELVCLEQLALQQFVNQ